MGGQACVLYGAAEFSRDTDLAILAETNNLARLRHALDELKAAVIAIPPFEQRYLNMGLAVHFRCGHEECAGMRIDVLSKMRGVAPFTELWTRRTIIELDEGPLDVLSLPDLVLAKKTQRDKDWPMISRLVEANYFEKRDAPSPIQIRFWLREMRTPELLTELVHAYPEQAEAAAVHRPLLTVAMRRRRSLKALRKALLDEQEGEKEADRRHWMPLKAELEQLRQQTRRRPDNA